MEILVTGGKGTIGQVLVPKLLEAGHIVSVYDLEDGCDILDTELLYDRVRSADLVIHMAAAVGRLSGEKHMAECIESNVIGTANVASLCAKHHVKLISFSTSEVYGSEYYPDILNQSNIYGLSKLAAEGVVEHLARERDLQAVIVRPFMVYGPPEKPRGELRSAISNFVDKALNGIPLVVHGDSSRAWLFVDDFCAAILALVDNFDEAVGGAYDIASDEYYGMDEVARMVLCKVGDGSYEVVEHPGLGVPVKESYDIGIRRWWAGPQVNLSEGLDMVIAYQRSL